MSGVSGSDQMIQFALLKTVVVIAINCKPKFQFKQPRDIRFGKKISRARPSLNRKDTRRYRSVECLWWQK